MEFRAVFISTVRTSDLKEKRSCSEFEDDDADLGFLSQPKMLNSAFTRAKSFLAVVGDPVALCTFGKCSRIWMEYLKQCEKMNGIYPETVNLGLIKFWCETLSNAPENPEVDENEVEENNKEKSSLRTSTIDDWNYEYQLEPDDILRQLAREAMQGSALGGDFQNESIQIAPEQIRLQERDGHAYIRYREERKNSRLRLTSENMDDEYDSDTESNVTDVTGIHQDFEPDKLRKLVWKESSKYKRCRIHIEGAAKTYAIPLDPPTAFKKILLTNRKRCGRAFHLDEVVVEILRETDTEGPVPEKIAYGQVIGILRHVTNPRYRLFVCQVEEGNSGIMVPLNRGVPKIINLELKSMERKRSEYTVTVYKFTQDKRVKFDRYEQINPFNPSSKLFVVRFLRWDAQFTHPLGIVVSVLEPGTTLDKAMEVLNIEHSIPSRFFGSTVDELNYMYPSKGYSIPTTAFQGRTDYRKKLVFTIDSDESMDLDDALSLEKLADGQFLIGIHISDVSYFVKKGSNIDAEARKRGTSFYRASGKPVHMLPEHLSTNLCSLLPGQERLTISLIIKVNTNGEIIEVNAKKTVIKSRCRLSYSEVENILAGLPPAPGKSYSEELISSIYYSSIIAQIWRKNRLGMAALYHSFDIWSQDSPRAHSLVEEFMITANQRVAMMLLKKYPLTTPLKTQLPPNDLELEEWRERFREEARNTVAFTRPFNQEICKCSGICSCIPPTTGLDDSKQMMDITKSVWQEILKSMTDGNMNRLQSLVVSPDRHPKLSVALMFWFYLQDKSQYVCSGDVPQGEQGHYSLNIGAYTHFTSPIRRYVDLVVHRLVSNLIEERSSVYLQAEVSEICSDCTDAGIRAARYEEATFTAQLCEFIQDKPMVIHPVVAEITDSNIQLNCSALRSVLRSNIKIKTSCLNLADKPVVSDENSPIVLTWSQRIYDHGESRAVLSNTLKPVVLNPDKFVLKTLSSKWINLVAEAKNKDKAKVQKALKSIESGLKDSCKDPNYVEELTSEGALIERKKHFCKYSLELHQGSVVNVQLTAELARGLLVPCVQMLSLTPLACVCTEHYREPVKCFASSDANKAIRSIYRNVYQYQDLWLPVIAMESARGAVDNGITAIVHNVQISWQEQVVKNEKSYVGYFKIGKSFCKERFIHQIIIDKQQMDYDEYLSADHDSISVRCFGYICVRYSNFKIQAPDTDLPLDRVVDLDQSVTWIGHCSALKATQDKEESILTVHIKLNQHSSPIPTQLLGTSPFLATIEWIPKTLPHKSVFVHIFI